MSLNTCFNFPKRFFAATVFFFLWASGMFAQNPVEVYTVSPYSRFGIGDFQSQGGMINVSMGAGGIGFRNDSLLPQYINLQNPASFTSHQVVAYELSLSSNTVQLQNSTSSGFFNRTTLGNIVLAFPVTKWWGAGFGLLPYTAVGYNVSTSDDPPGIGPVTYKYEGSGGINRLFFTNAFRPFAGMPRQFLLSKQCNELQLANDSNTIRRKLRFRNNLANISIGVNTSYLFGAIDNVRRDIFPDSAYTFNTKITKRTLYHDDYLDFGLQYSFRFRKSLNPLYTNLDDSNVTKVRWFHDSFNYHLNGRSSTAPLFVHSPGLRMTLGFIYSPPQAINVSYDLLAQTYTQVGTQELFRDTIVNDDGVPDRVLLPAMGGFGFALKKDYKWVFQADYMKQLWSQMTYLGTNPGLKDAQRITAGFRLQPKPPGRGGYFGAIQYSLGVRWYQTYLDLQNMQLTESSVNFCLALPVPYFTKREEAFSRFSLNFEYGMRGTTNQGLIKENFFRLTVGVTINDHWFNHYKYN